MTRDEVQQWLESWLSERDEPGSWEAHYEGRVFSNLWQLRFDADSHCAEYVEWYMEHPR